jgi:hypothetical protein
MIQVVADAFYQRLERNKIEYHSGTVEFSFQSHGNLIVMPMQRFPLAIGEDQKMRRGKIEVILGDFDAEKS